MENPLVSIVVTVYNEAQHLQKVLKCIQGQTYTNLEIILCDDCSSDSSLEMCQEIAKSDPRVKVLHNEYNLGVTGNFNRLRAAATGKYVMLRSAGDWMAETYIEHAVRVLNENPNIGLVYGETKFIDGQTFEEKEPQYPITSLDTTAAVDLVESMGIVIENFTSGDTNYGLIRSKLLRKIQAYGWFNGPDHVFIAEIALNSRIKRLEGVYDFREANQGDDQVYRLYSSRRAYREKVNGISAQRDYHKDIKFIQLMWYHCRMISGADISVGDKERACELAVDIINRRWGRHIDNEVMWLVQEFNDLLANFVGVNLHYDVFRRHYLEEICDAYQMAMFCRPDNFSLFSIYEFIRRAIYSGCIDAAQLSCFKSNLIKQGGVC